MARVLIVAGGCRGRSLGAGLIEDGHAARITTRTEAGRRPIEAVGAECFIGTPDRIGSLRYALEGVTVVCWLLGTAGGDAAVVAALHGSRLESMLAQMIDTTVRGIVYEAAGSVAASTLTRGAGLVEATAALNSVPYRCVGVDPAYPAAWLGAVRGAVDALL